VERVAVADQEHPDHQLRIDRRPARVTVKSLQLPTNLTKIEKVINSAEQMIGRDVILKAEIVKETPLIRRLETHHRRALPMNSTRKTESRFEGLHKRSLSTVSTRGGHS
jgi:hypothetical protein